MMKRREILLILCDLPLQLYYLIFQVLILGIIFCNIIFKYLYVLLEIINLIIEFFLFLLEGFLNSLKFLLIDSSSINLVMMVIDILSHLFEIVDKLIVSIISLLQLFFKMVDDGVLVVYYFFALDQLRLIEFLLMVLVSFQLLNLTYLFIYNTPQSLYFFC